VTTPLKRLDELDDKELSDEDEDEDELEFGVDDALLSGLVVELEELLDKTDEDDCRLDVLVGVEDTGAVLEMVPLFPPPPPPPHPIRPKERNTLKPIARYFLSIKPTPRKHFYF
jgi:hypothetical protein